MNNPNGYSVWFGRISDDENTPTSTWPTKEKAWEVLKGDAEEFVENRSCKTELHFNDKKDMLMATTSDGMAIAWWFVMAEYASGAYIVDAGHDDIEY